MIPTAFQFSFYAEFICGGVKFEVTLPFTRAIHCHCSRCRKHSGAFGLTVGHIPREQFRLLQGADVLTTYTFNTGVAKHTFCSVCGIKSFYTPRSHPDGISVNARCLDPGTVTSIRVSAFDGRHWEDTMARRAGGE